MITIGIDQSLSCSGICIFKNDQIIHFNCIKTTKEHGNLFFRCLSISKQITNLINQYKVNKVNIEGLPFNTRSNVTRDLAALQGVIICRILEQFNIECNIFAPLSIKKFATGNGKASKQEMVEALPNDFITKILDKGFKKSTGLYDIADAYWIGKFNKK